MEGRSSSFVAGFGASGQVLTPFVDTVSNTTSSIVAHPDGKVTIGYPTRTGLDIDLVLAQFGPMGTLNPSFGDGGVLKVAPVVLGKDSSFASVLRLESARPRAGPERHHRLGHL